VSDVELTDHTDLAKILVRAEPDGGLAASLSVPYGRAVHDADGALVVGTAPDAWLLLAPLGSAGSVSQRIEGLVDGEFVSVVDVTHGHTALRLTGSGAADVLAKLCAVDLSDAVTPSGSAVRTLLAGITATVIRDDAAGELSYLALCDRSYGQYLADVLADAGISR
jgi:heterotetrameric sarcosine oxidase gamma subunit